MAMSDWDTLAYDYDGNLCDDGIFKHPNGSSLEIYKDRVHVHDPAAWVAGSQFIKPITAQIYSGELQIAGFTIHAQVNDISQHAIFVYADYFDYLDENKNNKNDKEYVKRCFGGIGCYGHVNKIPTYVEKLNLDPKLEWYSFSEVCSNNVTHWLENLETRQQHQIPDDFYIDDTWVGISQEVLDLFHKFLENVEETYSTKEWMEKIKNNNGKKIRA